MIYEELKIQLDLNEPVDVLKSIGMQTKDNDWFVICDKGDCHLFDNNGNEIDVKKIKSLDEWLIPKYIKKIVVPDSIEYIKEYAFFNCTKLTSINIPDSTKSIGDNAFFNCINLTSVNIPNLVKSIGDSAFFNCPHLTSINIPDSVRNIESWAFGYCINLTSIIIPNLANHIGHHTFNNCKNLKSLTFKGKTIDQVKSMKYYPWGIKDESIIKYIS